VISDLRRFNAYKGTLDEAGLPFREEWCVWASLKQLEFSPQECLKHLFSSGSECPDAIFALNDSIGIAVLECFDRMGVRVPEDVAVVGVGDIMISRYRRMNLTTIVEPLEEMGRVAAETVLDLIDNPSQKPIHRIVNRSELVIRKTT
jgi:LacI family transcriptional regulator